MIRSELALFRAVFVDAADAMLILDDERRVVEANVAACVLFDVSHDAICGRPLDSLIADEGATVATEWAELLAFGESKREHRVRGIGGPRRIECSYRAAVHANRHLCIARDVTDRRALEDRLAESEKIESVGRLAGGIAHDFNNLLTAILGYTELLLSHKLPADPDRPDLEEIQRAGQRAAALTQQLLAFSRRQVLLPKDVDLNQALASLQTMLARLVREDITLTCELSSEAAIVRIDPAQLEQVVVNLVLNARDALPTGGRIRIDVARVPRSRVDGLDTNAVASEYVRLRVIDSGVGISAEARAHLFEPFFTTKDFGKGSGLGLASVYGIVRQSNGLISVDSQPGEGTTFTMYFPAVPHGSHLLISSSRKKTSQETILLVEDEDAVRVIVGAVLRRQGYNVLEAATPGAAFDIFERRGCEIDLLLTDVVMPEMNGPALAQRLVAARPDLRVLFISGYADVAIRIETDNPTVGFLSKPFQASTLTRRVRDLLAVQPLVAEPVKHAPST